MSREVKVLSMSESEIKRHWDEVAKKFIPVDTAYSTSVMNEGEFWLFGRYYPVLKDKKVLKLDLWNEAYMLPILSKAYGVGMQIYGIDISKEVVEKAHDRFEALNIPHHFVIADMRVLPFEDNFFDYIWTMGTLEHVPDPEKSIRDMYRILKPGGRAIIGIPYKYDPFGCAFAVWLGNKLDILPYGEELVFTWPQMKKLVQAAPFKIVGRSGAYFFPWFIRFADMFFNQRLPVLSIPLWPLIWLFGKLDKINFLRKYNRILAIIVEKPQ